VTISGLINPLTENAFTDITMKFQSIELTSFTPYSGKFLGYKIDKGKLHLDLRYILAGRTLDSQNHIVFDQLTLGEKVESPDATSLPLKLAIGLLKDSKGVIDLDIPVKGSLDDPKFSVWPIVWKALLNLLVKAVTSPFKLLGALFGGGNDEDLEYVSFSPGADSLATGQRAKLDSLARALTERPGLKLDVRGNAALAVDREALATKTISAQIRTEGELDLAQISKAERERLLKLYKGTFNEDPYLLVPEKDDAGKKIPRSEREAAIVAAAFRQLVTQYQISENELRTLAQSRAAAIKDRLVAKGGIEELRIFLQDVEIQEAAEAGEVRVKLSLDAR
jgi:hypothetical protein